MAHCLLITAQQNSRISTSATALRPATAVHSKSGFNQTQQLRLLPKVVKIMARLRTGSRRFLLGAAFLCVMAGTGGLLGAIGGVMLVLLSRALLGAAGSMLLVMPTGIGVGMVVAMLVSVFLMSRRS